MVKNVTGYDLSKLMCGSLGTLAVLTEVTIKVLPAPEATLTLMLPGLDDEAAVAAMTRALNGPHDNHYWVDSNALDRAGTWQIRAHVLGPASTPVVLTFAVTLHS